MPVTENKHNPSDEENVAQSWGLGSIRQKIQLWEGIESISKKPPAVRRRPPLLYDTPVETTPAHHTQADTKPESKGDPRQRGKAQPDPKQQGKTQTDPKLTQNAQSVEKVDRQKQAKPNHKQEKPSEASGYVERTNDARIKNLSTGVKKNPQDNGIIRAQQKPKPPEADHTAQQPPTQPRAAKRHSSKEPPPVPTAAPRDSSHVTTGSVKNQHGGGSTEDKRGLHAPELVAQLMGQPTTKPLPQRYTEYTYEEQEDDDDDDDDDEDYDVREHHVVADHGAGAKKNKRSEVYLTLAGSDTVVLDDIPEVRVARAADDLVVRHEVKDNGDKPEIDLGLYPIDEYDSESTSATVAVDDLPTSRDYAKAPAPKAETYEVKLAALLYLRGINNKMEFKLAANVAGVGNFGDIVFKYKTQTEDKRTVWKTCFIQLKCRETTALTTEALTAKEGSFSLEDGFRSYSEIASNMSPGNSDFTFNGFLSDCSFALYTNANVADRLGLRLRAAPSGDMEKLIKSGVNDELIFSLSEDRDKDIYAALGPGKRRFLQQLIVFSGEPSEIDLDHMVKMELRSACSNYLSNVHIIYRFFIEAVQQWWHDDTHFLTQKENVLDRAESILNVYNLTASQRMLFKLQDISFQSSHLAQWKDDIRKGNSLLCIVTTGMTSKFSCTKLMQILWEENVEYIFTGLKSLLQQDKEVLREWASGEKDMLVIASESSEDHDDLCEDLCRVIKKKPHKQLIVISAPGDPFTVNLQLKYGSNYEELYDPFDLLQLDKESTDAILEKEVRFQGCPIYLKCIVGENVEKISKILTSENFDLILDNTMINIGTELSGHFDGYIKRTFQRCDLLKPDLLTADDFWGILAVSNTTVDELQGLVSPGKKVGRSTDPDSKELRYLVLESLYPAEEYSKLCADRRDVHWVHMLDEGNMLLWKRSQRNISTLFAYKDDVSSAYQPEHVLDLDDRVILVVADPRMGKTTLTTQLAIETKQADPSMWVIKAHLNTCTAFFDAHAVEEINAVEFLTTVGVDQNKVDFLDHDLLRYSVEEVGNVAVFLDGFDAVVPRYLRKVLALLSSLVESKIRKIFITSQHGMKDMLETHLATFAYKMCPDDRVKEVYV